MKAEGAVLEKRDSQGLQTVHYQEGLEPGAGVPEGVYDLVLSNRIQELFICRCTARMGWSCI